jgi:hypothetical protein
VQCEDPRETPAGVLLATEGDPVALETDSCNSAYVVIARDWRGGVVDPEAEHWLHATADRGATFLEPIQVGVGRDLVAITDRAGGLHLIFMHDHQLLQRYSRGIGQELGSATVVWRQGVPRLRHAVYRNATAVGEADLALAWSTVEPSAIWYVQLHADRLAFAPRQIFTTSSADIGVPRICHAEPGRVVVVWNDGAGEIIAAVADGPDGDFEQHAVGRAEPDLPIDVACGGEGRAIAVWIDPDNAVEAASLSSCGDWNTQTLVEPAHLFYPYYPRVHISGDRALVIWRAELEGPGYMTLDVDGSDRTLPVYLEDHYGAVVADGVACGLEGLIPRFAMLNESINWDLDAPNITVGSLIGGHGELIASEELAYTHDERYGYEIVCDGDDRTSVVWWTGDEIRDNVEIIFKTWDPHG